MISNKFVVNSSSCPWGTHGHEGLWFHVFAGILIHMHECNVWRRLHLHIFPCTKKRLQVKLRKRRRRIFFLVSKAPSRPSWPYIFFSIDLSYIPWIPLKKSVIFPKSWTSTGQFSTSTGSSATTLFCLISVGHNSKLHIAITFYQHHHFSPSKLYHISQCA